MQGLDRWKYTGGVNKGARHLSLGSGPYAVRRRYGSIVRNSEQAPAFRFQSYRLINLETSEEVRNCACVWHVVPVCAVAHNRLIKSAKSSPGSQNDNLRRLEGQCKKLKSRAVQPTPSPLSPGHISRTAVSRFSVARQSLAAPITKAETFISTERGLHQHTVESRARECSTSGDYARKSINSEPFLQQSQCGSSGSEEDIWLSTDVEFLCSDDDQYGDYCEDVSVTDPRPPRAVPQTNTAHVTSQQEDAADLEIQDLLQTSYMPDTHKFSQRSVGFLLPARVQWTPVAEDPTDYQHPQPASSFVPANVHQVPLAHGQRCQDPDDIPANFSCAAPGVAGEPLSPYHKSSLNVGWVPAAQGYWHDLFAT
jgi:hypothetical protein